MEPFLKQIARDLYTTYGDSISNFCMVFPNRRAGVFFEKFLTELIQTPVWSPHITTVNDLMQNLSELQLEDRLNSIFKLYHIYINARNIQESFDTFYFWGEMLLEDFNDIDKYRVNPADLFQNLASIKSIESTFDYLTEQQIEAIKSFWAHFNPQAYSRHQHNFINLWEVLYTIYQQFTAQLKNDKRGYEGMLYREVAEKIKAGTLPELPYQKVVMVGFNALNKCETELFSHLHNSGQGMFYWDYDTYYTNDSSHEAGYFIRQYSQQYPPQTSFDHDHLNQEDKNIHFYSVPTETGQAKLVPQILREMEPESNTGQLKTAIILPNENLLIPVLHALPSAITNVNVTMGYPLKNTPVFSLIDHLIELQKNIRILEDGTAMFYHQFVINILNHQYINPQFPEQINDFIYEIHQKNKIYVKPEELHLNELMGTIFTPQSTTEELSQYLLNILFYISRFLTSQQEPEEEESINTLLDKEFIYHLYKQIKRLREIIHEQAIKLESNTYVQILKKVMQNIHVPFTGEPLAGLQIMGLLETRNLDFENIIFLSMNEGDLPKQEMRQSYIPHNLRKGFGLPTIDHQDAMYGYYFYRMLQRARNVSLIYHTKSDGIQKGEMSRFLYQLKYESGFTIHHHHVTHHIGTSLPKPITVAKTPEINKILKAYVAPQGTQTLSPTALNAYIDCPLKFYFQYIAHLEEPEEMVEEVDASLFGNLLHQSLYKLYHSYINQELSGDILQSLQHNTQIDHIIDEVFLQEYFKNEYQTPEYTGKNIIVKHILRKYIHQLVELDKRFLPFTIKNLEVPYNMYFPITLQNQTTQVKLGGKIDRIDMQANAIRIIDYKTGRVDPHFKTIEELFSPGTTNRKTTAFQVLFYTLLYQHHHTDHYPVIPSVYPLMDSFTPHFTTTLQNSKTKEIIRFEDYEQPFRTSLHTILTELFNPEVPFTQTENINICSYCAYNKICHRD